MEYGRVVKRSLEILWRYKVLWVFGVAAVLFGADGGASFNMPPRMQYSLSSSDFQRWSGPLPPGMEGFSTQMAAMRALIIPLLGAVACLGLVWLIVSLIARYTAQGALISSVNEVEDTEVASFVSGLQTGWQRFLRLFAIDLIIGLVMIPVVVVLVILAIAGAAMVALPAVLLSRQALSWLAIVWAIVTGLGIVLMLILVAIVLAIIVTLIREYAYRSCVIEKRGVFASLGDGIVLFRTRLRESTLMWLLLAAIRLMVGIITLPLAFLALGSIAAPAGLAYALARTPLAALIVALPLALGFGVLAIFFGGLYHTFESSAWTLTYRELRGQALLAEPAA